jgi:hypothetical protein
MEMPGSAPVARAKVINAPCFTTNSERFVTLLFKANFANDITENLGYANGRCL